MSSQGRHRGHAGGGRKSAEDMDLERREKVAVEYLCRLAEAREWMEACVGDPMEEDASVVLSSVSGGLMVFEERLRNGVDLARLAAHFAPELVTHHMIFDLNQEKYMTDI